MLKRSPLRPRIMSTLCFVDDMLFMLHTCLTNVNAVFSGVHSLHTDQSMPPGG